jgi:hypothetical protein
MALTVATMRQFCQEEHHEVNDMMKRQTHLYAHWKRELLDAFVLCQHLNVLDSIHNRCYQKMNSDYLLHHHHLVDYMRNRNKTTSEELTKVKN